MPSSRHTRDFHDMVRDLRELIASRTPPADGRFAAVVEGLREGLASERMLAAAQVMFEDYAAVRLCARAMLRLFSLRMTTRTAAAAS